MMLYACLVSFLCVVFCRPLFVFLLLCSFRHCVVCPSVYVFWLPLWCLQTILTASVKCYVHDGCYTLMQLLSYRFFLFRENLNSDDQQFHQYHPKPFNTKTYDVENPYSVLVQAHRYSQVRPIGGILMSNCVFLIFLVFCVVYVFCLSSSRVVCAQCCHVSCVPNVASVS